VSGRAARGQCTPHRGEKRGEPGPDAAGNTAVTSTARDVKTIAIAGKINAGSCVIRGKSIKSPVLMNTTALAMNAVGFQKSSTASGF
jgi:hypothetical protein